MPQVAAAAAAAVTWVSSTLASAGALVATSLSVYTGVSIGTAIAITNAAGSLLINASLAALSTALMQPRVGQGGSPIQFKADPAAPISGVMGRFGVSGRQVHANTWGKDNLYMTFMVALSLGPIQSYEKFTANTLEVTFPGPQGLAANVEPYKDKMWQTRRLGLPTDAYLTIPTGVPDGNPAGGGVPFAEWTPAHTLPGFAISAWTLKNNSKRASYESGVPLPIWLLHGMLLWDPAKDDTYPGGSGPQRRDDWRTWGYTEDPYHHALAWVRGHFKLNPDGSIDRTKRLAGIGAPDSTIDIAAFVEGANVCAANGWKIAGEWTTVDDKWQVLAAMLQAGGGVPLNRGAQISCMVETPRVSLLTLTREDIIGPVSLNVMASRRDRPNTIVPRVRLEAQNFEEVALGAVTSETYRTEDGDEPRTREIAYPYVGQAKQGAELAAYGLANARETLKGSFPCKPYLLGLRAGDAFTVAEPELGLNGQKFVLLGRPFEPASATVTLDARSETDAKHPWALGQAANPPATPSLTVVSTVTEPDASDWTLTAETFTDNGSAVPALVLAGAVSNDNIDQVIFEYRPVTVPESPWTSAGSDGPTVERKEITGLTSGTAYQAAVSYKRGPGVSERLILGPVTASATVTPPATALGNVAGTPALTINTGIAADGTEASLLTSSWSGVTGASSYDIEIDDGAGGWFESSPVVSLKNIRVRTGLTYRVRIRAVNRDGVRSAAWSAWSASVSAGGDTTAPGVVAASSVTALARRCVLVWTNPTDADFSHVRLYRNITGSAHTEADLYAVRVEGSTYTDTNVQAGVTYSYAAKTVDRTGNIGAFKFVGAATPTYITAGGGGGVYPDIAPNDPEIVTEFGTSALVFGQGPGATAPAAQVMNNRTEGDTSFIALPEGGAKVGASSQTGAVKIILPPGAVGGADKDSMVQMSVDIYEYGASASTTYVLRGYTFNGGSRFMNVSAQLLGARSVTRPVRFGFDTVLSRFCIWIGDPGGAWSYPNVRVRDVTVGYSNFAEATWRAGWQVEFSTGTQFYNPADVVALPRASDAVFGEGVFEVAGGIVATRPNFRTDQGTAALVAGQGPLVTLTPPSYASNAAALSSGATIGSAYMNTTTGLLDTVIAPGAGTIGYKHFASPAGGFIVTGSVSGVVAGSLLNVTVTMQGGSLSADAAMTGTITVEEGVGGVYSQVGQVQTVTINSTGLIEPGGSYSAENASATVIAAGSKSGSVTYRFSFARTSGPTYVNGAVIDVSMTITPPL